MNIRGSRPLRKTTSTSWFSNNFRPPGSLRPPGSACCRSAHSHDAFVAVADIGRGRTDECVMRFHKGFTEVSNGHFWCRKPNELFDVSTLILNFEILIICTHHDNLYHLGLFFFLPTHIPDLDALTCGCWGFCHMSRVLRHTFPVIESDKFYCHMMCAGFGVHLWPHYKVHYMTNGEWWSLLLHRAELWMDTGFFILTLEIKLFGEYRK